MSIEQAARDFLAAWERSSTEQHPTATCPRCQIRIPFLKLNDWSVVNAADALRKELGER